MKRKTALEKMLGVIWVLGCLAVGVGLPQTAVADSGDSPYAGKTIRILIGSTPGGSHDLEARVIARHVSKYIAGNPNVIVQNMPGAGSLIMVAYLYNRARPDGLTWGVVATGPFLDAMLGDNPKFDPVKMPAVWAVAGAGVAVLRDSVAGNVKDFRQVNPSKIAIAGRIKGGASCLKGRLYLDLLGIEGYKTVCAYRGTSLIAAAIERGEANFFSANDANLVGSGAFADMTRRGRVIPLFQSGLLTPNGRIVRSSTVDKGIPTFYEVMEAIYGKPPEGIRWQALKAISLGLNSLKRTLLLPPGTPKKRVDEIRRAIDETAEDPDFVTEWEKVFGQQLDSVRITGQRAEEVKSEAFKPAPWQNFLKNYAQK